MPNVSIMLPVQVSDLGTALPYARIAAQTPTSRLWSGQSMGIETHAIFTSLATTGMGLKFGSAVTLMPLRHPYTAALAARSVASVSGATYIAGIGPGAKVFQQAVLGQPYPSPLRASRDYANHMRTLLDGQPIRIDPDGPPLHLPDVGAPPVEIGLGVLRQKMAHLAGEVADWALTWLTPLPYLKETIIPTMSAAAAQAGRPTPRVAAVLHCVPDRPGRDPAEPVVKIVGVHLNSPHYGAMLGAAGIDLEGKNTLDRARSIVQAGVVATGDPAQIAAHIHQYFAAGIDEVIVNMGGIHVHEGPGRAVSELSAIIQHTMKGE